jgi:NAD(P)-dependent dehydrogenase (short-subunit alcohol dehydrogenase family)
MSSIKNLMSLHGRRALITGAAGNIGQVIAETLAELGADLLLVDRPGTDFTSQIEKLKQWGTQVHSEVCDLEQQRDREELIKFTEDGDKNISVLVNNAAFVGTSSLQGWAVKFEDQSVETWRRALEVNLTAAFDLCKGLAPQLRRATGASISNIGSIYGSFGPDYSLYQGTEMSNPAAYGASKGGLMQFSRWLATTLAPQVRVNSISPGGVFRNQPTEFVDRYCARTPLGRMATEEDFRGAIAYLASDLSQYVTGHNLAVDGGWGVW